MQRSVTISGFYTMNYAEYTKSLELLEKLITHFMSINEIELVERVCGLIPECDQNYYQTLLIMANAENPKIISEQDIIAIRKTLADESTKTLLDEIT